MSIDNQTATFPIGDVDFNKPIRHVDGRSAAIVGVLPGALEHRIVVLVEGDDIITQVDLDGIDTDGSEAIENVKEAPSVLFVRLLQDDDGDYFVDEEAYDSEDDARSTAVGFSSKLIKIAAIDLPVAGDAASDEIVESINLDGVEIKPGMTVKASRRGFGTRVANVIKVRNDVRKSLFIDPLDGNSPYWALNKNIVVD